MDLSTLELIETVDILIADNLELMLMYMIANQIIVEVCFRSPV